uniref:Protein kinase domain-containing protein n=1 Tax=Eptatretus burgeri TaxID=7764 RepID=A0A8C4R4V5_EPTBU
MDAVGIVLELGHVFYGLSQGVKVNRERSRRLTDRVQVLLAAVSDLKDLELDQNAQSSTRRTLLELANTLQAAQDCITTYGSRNLFKRVFQAAEIQEEFEQMNGRVADAAEALSLSLQAETVARLCEAFKGRREEDARDRFKDDGHLDLLLGRFEDGGCKSTPGISYCLTPPPPRNTRKIFLTEAATMTNFESLNVVRVFGVCLDPPEMQIVMERCALGSLRHVLDRNLHLEDHLKLRMARDAARGLYRLHQCDEDFRLHRCITSSSFLVDEAYTVKVITPRTPFCIKGKRATMSELYFCHQANFLCSGMSIEEISQKISQDRWVEPLPPGCPTDFAVLLSECRSFDPLERPTAGGELPYIKGQLSHDR